MYIIRLGFVLLLIVTTSSQAFPQVAVPAKILLVETGDGFHGDVDGDGRLDLYVDVSWHYNVC